MEKYSKYIIESSSTLIEALQLMDINDSKLLLVFENSKFKSIVSIGDLQRSLIKDNNFHIVIDKILRSNIKLAKISQSKDEIKKLMYEHRIEFMPIVNDKTELIDVLFWEDLEGKGIITSSIHDDLPVVIMAGGKGTRLQPITNIIPKPLVPIGDKSMVEIIMDSFKESGLSAFYMSVNYKADIIKYYLSEFKDIYNIEYFTETKPLGTAGSLKMLQNKIQTPFFVSNCDILVDQDYSEIYKYHVENGNELTAVAAVKTYTIPYGTMELSKNGLLKKLSEKPSNTVYVNAGLYILEPHLLNEIPDQEFYHITHLMEKIKNRGGKVGVFPVTEGAWMDIGEWNEYGKTQEKFKKRLKKRNL